MIKKLTAFLAILLACLLASCGAANPVLNTNVSADLPTVSATELPTATPAPTETPKSTAQLLAEMETQIEQSIRDNMQFGVVSLLPEGEDPERLDINLFNHSESQWMLSVRDDVDAAIKAAVDQTENDFSAEQGLRFDRQLTGPSWQYLYMLVQMAKNDVSQCGKYISMSLSVEASAEIEVGETVVTIYVEPVYYRDAILSIVGDDKLAYLEAESAYDYMNTVFDENIDEKEYILPPAEGNLAADITWPLKQYIRLRKTWYAARDDGARKHTGTDIWAKEGTEIYSCTAGTVFYIGFWGGGGNTVVVMDDYGYLFYYHHMVSITDFLQEGQRVEAGQLVGHVGNTGNSARDHLHLTIIHPDGIIVNPYTYLKDALPD